MKEKLAICTPLKSLYKCNICKKAFLKPCNLGVHISSVHKGKNPAKKPEIRLKISETVKKHYREKREYGFRCVKNHYIPPREEQSERMKRRIREGKINVRYWKGKKNPKHSKWLKDHHVREKHSNWQGGKSFEPYNPYFNNDLKRKIRGKYNYTCQICGKRYDTEHDCAIHCDVHHMDSNKKNSNEENLILLCSSCHIKMHRGGLLSS